MQYTLKGIKAVKIRNIFQNIIVLVIILSSSSAIYANSESRKARPIQLAAVSVLGYGASVGYYLFPRFYLGFESFSLSDEGAILDVELNYKFSTNQLIGRYFPWDQYGFFLQMGFLARDWVVEGSNETYVGDDTVKRDTDIDIKWSETAVSYGIGWYLIGKTGLSGGFGIGFMAGGSPEVTIEAVGASSNDIDLEQREAAETLKSYNVFPYTHLSIGYNF